MEYQFEFNWTEFCFFSANLVHVFGEKDLPELYALYLRTASAVKAQGLDSNLQNHISKTLNISLLEDCPSLIVSFHYGSYWYLPLELLKQGCKVAILVSSDVIEKQKKFYLKNLETRLHDNLVFIDAERASVAYEIKKMSMKSYHIVCYIDGGAGIIPLSSLNKKNLFNITFGQGLLSVRKGIFEIAYLLHLPVYYYHQQSTTLKPENPVCFQPLSTISRSDYVTRVVTELYSLLYERLFEDLTLWEGWFFMHYSVDTMLLKNARDSLYLPFCIEKRYYIMNICNYESREISKENFDLVQHKIGYQLGIC